MTAYIIHAPNARNRVEPDIQDVSALVASLEGRTCTWMRVYVASATERIFDHPFGKLVRDAAAHDGIEIVVAGASGVTRAFRAQLRRDEEQGRVSFRVAGSEATLHANAFVFAFTPKQKTGGEERIALVGSGDLGGAFENDELFVIHKERALLAPTSSAAIPVADREWRRARAVQEWPELDAILDKLVANARPVEWDKMPAKHGSVGADNAPKPIASEVLPAAVKVEAAQPQFPEAFEEILDALLREQLADLCGRLQLLRTGTKDDLAARLRTHLGQDTRALIAALNADELRSSLDTELVIDDKVFEFQGLVQAGVDDLRRAAERRYLDEWKPQTDRESVAGAITVAVVERIDPGETSDLPEFESFDPNVGRDDMPAPLADFQAAALDALRAHYARPSNDRGLLCLPTGAGKIRTALHFILSEYIAKNRRVVWIAHRRELLDQVQVALRRLAKTITGLRPFTVSRVEHSRQRLDGDVVLVSSSCLVGPAISRRVLDQASRKPLGIICFDDVHRGTAFTTRKKLAQLRRDPAGKSPLPVLAVTTTPFREMTDELSLLTGARPVYQKTFAELVQAQFLARPNPQPVRLESTSKGFELTSAEEAHAKTKRALAGTLLSRLGKHEARNAEIVELWVKRKSVLRQTIVFACDIDHAQELHRLFGNRGVLSYLVHAELDASDIRAALQKFRDLYTPGVLIDAGVLSEGVDVPSARTVLLARPTMSTVEYREMIARGARGPRTCPGKTDFQIVDCIDNFTRFGLPLELAMAGDDVLRELPLEASEPAPVQPAAIVAPSAAANAATEGLALLLARDPNRTVSSLWGTLSWMKPSGDADAIAVFLEQLAVVQEAAFIVEDCALGRSDRWDSARALSDYLETEGVLLAPNRWLEMIHDVRQTSEPPKLVEMPQLKNLANAEQAKRLAPSLRIGSPPEARPDRAGVSASSSVEMLVDRDRAAVSASSSIEMLVDLGMHVASADGDVTSHELGALRDCVFRLADSDDSGLLAEIEQACARGMTERLTVRAVGEHLCTALSLKQRLATVDMAFAIANADKRVVPEELALIMRIANLLELPEWMIAARSNEYAIEAPAIRELAGASYVACPKCDASWPHGNLFCGRCGGSLPSTPGW